MIWCVVQAAGRPDLAAAEEEQEGGGGLLLGGSRARTERFVGGNMETLQVRRGGGQMAFNLELPSSCCRNAGVGVIAGGMATATSQTAPAAQRPVPNLAHRAAV